MRTLVLILLSLLAAATMTIGGGLAAGDYLYQLAVADCARFDGVPVRLDDRIMHQCLTPSGIIER